MLLRSSADESCMLLCILERSRFRAVGKVVFGCPTILVVSFIKYALVALFAGISLFLRSICPKRVQRV